MTKEHYDEAYQMESRKFPAIVRMTNLNLIILHHCNFYNSQLVDPGFCIQMHQGRCFRFSPRTYACSDPCMGHSFGLCSGIQRYDELVIHIPAPLARGHDPR